VMHMEASDTEIEKVEGLGALNFLAMDEIPLSMEGEPLNLDSVIEVPFNEGLPVFPDPVTEEGRRFLQKVDASGHKWVVLTDKKDQPRMVMDADHFLRNTLLHSGKDSAVESCHRPIIVKEGNTSFGEIMPRFKNRGKNKEDDIIEKDVVLLWGEERRIITGSDILGRLLRGIVIDQRHLGHKSKDRDPS
jgi:metal transporter CNNM